MCKIVLTDIIYIFSAIRFVYIPIKGLKFHKNAKMLKSEVDWDNLFGKIYFFR